ncbi:collagen alpha-1(I) chain-like [Vulpes lagopus]|uniref:collagen alpha-1(I) chain-like n=1 Tax=Vulpes lagopus TaxID=494514 RepID=UPI001BC99564|nr:collagen alpha-1(I) chain-like [Vulpes lagopus]
MGRPPAPPAARRDPPTPRPPAAARTAPAPAAAAAARPLHAAGPARRPLHAGPARRLPPPPPPAPRPPGPRHAAGGAPDPDTRLAGGGPTAAAGAAGAAGAGGLAGAAARYKALGAGGRACAAVAAAAVAVAAVAVAVAAAARSLGDPAAHSKRPAAVLAREPGCPPRPGQRRRSPFFSPLPPASPRLASRRVGSGRGGAGGFPGGRETCQRGGARRGRSPASAGSALPRAATRGPRRPKFPQRLQTTLLFAEVCVPTPGMRARGGGTRGSWTGRAGAGGGGRLPRGGRGGGRGAGGAGGAGPAGRGARARLRTRREGPCCTGAARLPLVPAPDSPAGGSPLPAGAACRRGWGARGEARAGPRAELPPGASRRPRPQTRGTMQAARAPLLGPGAPGAPWARAAGVRRGARSHVLRFARRRTKNGALQRLMNGIPPPIGHAPSRRAPQPADPVAAALHPGPPTPDPRPPTPTPDPDPGAGPGRRRRRRRHGRRRARLAAAGADGAGPTAVEREQTFAGLLHGGDKGCPAPAAAGSGPHCLLAREPASVARSQVTHRRVPPALPAGWKGPSLLQVLGRGRRSPWGRACGTDGGSRPGYVAHVVACWKFMKFL